MATEADRTNIGVITTIVAVGAFAMIAVSLAVTALVRGEVRELADERGSNADLNTVRELKSAQRSALSSPAHWADKVKGVVAIPIERAMHLVTDDIHRNPRHATPLAPGAKPEPDAGAPRAKADAGAGRGQHKRPDRGKHKGKGRQGSLPGAPVQLGGSGGLAGSAGAPGAPSAPQSPAPTAPAPAPTP